MERYFRRVRRKISSKGTAFSKHVGGEPSDATFGRPGTDGVRRPILQKGEIAVGKDLGPDFFLVIKHPALFTALLPNLVDRLTCHAKVRNPLAVLASRSSLGRDEESATALPRVLRMYDDDLSREIDAMDGDIVASRGKVLSTIVPAAKDLDEPLESRNLSELYDREGMLRIGERLLRSEGAYWRFYTKESVENLLAAIP